jgi:cysteate synthase
MDMLRRLAAIDSAPAAGVAVACLQEAVSAGQVRKESVILLNITGGGRVRLGRDHSLIPFSPQLRLTRKMLGDEETIRRITALPAALEPTRA